jgi:hypothetical protein
MAHRTAEIREAAVAAVVEFGGKVIETGWTGGCHQYVVFSTPDGRTVKQHFSGSPSASNTHHCVRSKIRSAVKGTGRWAR